MDFIWGGNKNEKNQQRVFCLKADKKIDRLEICAVDNYQVYFDDKFIAYGPERTAAGYSRKKVLKCEGVLKIEIKVISHGIDTYMCDFQEPFFAANVYCGDQKVYGSKDFTCYIDLSRDTKTGRYSCQRGFIEKRILGKENKQNVGTYSVDAPIILDGIGDTANYSVLKFETLSEGEYKGVDVYSKPWWADDPRFKTEEGSFNVEKDFLTKKEGFSEMLFTLPTVKTGFLKVDFESKGESEIYIAFDEILVDGKWVFGRSECNDLFVYNCSKGKFSCISDEPYTMKYIKVIYKGNVRIKPSIISYENAQTNFVSYEGDEKIVAILDAAKNSFAQNAVDIFTDCAGRERAGWLCDSYFTAKAERLFTGDNKIEKSFLENFILAKTEELPDGMLPMCFPSEHSKNHFIPNWAMWFVLQLEDRLERTKDRVFIDAAKEKVYKLLKYFKGFENEFGLLENLESWIFVEWSIANDPEYVKGINFPSNMLYSAMLKCAGKLYGDNELTQKAEKLKKAIIKYSYNGQFFVDNAQTVNGKIVAFSDHISETCQYYALYFDIFSDKDFVSLIKENFGPNRKQGFQFVGKSNVFIGYYLRLFWLLTEKEYDMVLNEAVEYFYTMAKQTGTLWEHDLATASCNHGFTSAIAVILLNALIGYKTVENGKIIVDKDFKGKNIIKVF